MTHHPELNLESVQRRLVAIRERLDELRQLEEVTEARLGEDWLTRAAVERVLTQLVELAAQINTHIVAVSGKVPPDQYRESFIAAAEIGALPADLATEIAPSAGLRNILVHQYLDADLGIVAQSVGQATVDYAAYVRAIAAWLSAQASDSDAPR
jgi:uncharacterized protein YutE (UPF0331/DUF86 family)